MGLSLNYDTTDRDAVWEELQTALLIEQIRETNPERAKEIETCLDEGRRDCLQYNIGIIPALPHAFSFGLAASLSVAASRFASVLGLTQFSSRFGWARLLPIPIGFGVGGAKSCQVEKSLEEERISARVPLPESVKNKIGSSLTFQEGIELIRQYPHATFTNHQGQTVEFAGLVANQLFDQASTPLSYLVLAHTLLDVFALNPSLTSEQKNEFGLKLQRLFDQSIQTFKSVPLEYPSLDDQPIGLFTDLDQNGVFEESLCTRQRSDDFVRPRIGYVLADVYGDGEKEYYQCVSGPVDDDKTALIQKLAQEKQSLLQMLDSHHSWVLQRLEEVNPNYTEAYQAQAARIRERFDLEFSTDWVDIQGQWTDPAYITETDIQLPRVQASFGLMAGDYRYKTIGFSAAKKEIRSDDFVGGVLPFDYAPIGGAVLAGKYFLERSGPLGLLTVPYAHATSHAWAPFGAQMMLNDRKLPITMCFPGFGPGHDVGCLK